MEVFIKFCDFSFKISRPQLLRHSLPRFFRAQSARGEFARARSARVKRVLGAKRTPPFGWFHEPRSEAESALRKEITHPQGALTCTCTRLPHVRAGERAHMRTQMCVPESAHTCTCTYAPAGCMKSTHPKRNDRSKARSRKT